MADTYKALAQGQLANTSTAIYTVPGSTKCVEPSLWLYNTNATTQTVKVHFYDGTTSRQAAQLELLAGAYAQISFDKTVFEAADEIRAETTTATQVNYWLSGVEIS